MVIGTKVNGIQSLGYKMAESADFNNSAQYVNFNVTNLDRDAFIFHKYNLNLSYDGIRLKWNNTCKKY